MRNIKALKNRIRLQHVRKGLSSNWMKVILRNIELLAKSEQKQGQEKRKENRKAAVRKKSLRIETPG